MARSAGTHKEDPDWETVGRHLPTFDEDGVLVASEVEVYHSLHIPLGANKEVKAAATVEFYETFYHEMAHVIHYKLTYEEMEAWEKVMEEDPIALTSYVELARRKDEKRGKREDFCESFSYYIMSSAAIRLASPKRYEYMNNLITSYMKENHKEVFKKIINEAETSSRQLWKENGWSDEEILRANRIHAKPK